MVHVPRRWLGVGLLLCGLACSRTPSAAPALDAGSERTDCDAVAARVTGLRLAKVPDQARQAMHAKVVQSCNEKDPPVEVRRCVVGARTLAELDRCGAAAIGGARFAPEVTDDDEPIPAELTLEPRPAQP